MKLREFLQNDMVLFLEDAQQHKQDQKIRAAASETDLLLHSFSSEDTSSSQKQSTPSDAQQSSSQPQKEVVGEIIREVPAQQHFQIKDMHLEQSLFPTHEDADDFQTQSQQEQPLLHHNLAQTNKEYQQSHATQPLQNNGGNNNNTNNNQNFESNNSLNSFNSSSQQSSSQPIIIQQPPIDTNKLRESIEKEILEKLQKTMSSSENTSSQNESASYFFKEKESHLKEKEQQVNEQKKHLQQQQEELQASKEQFKNALEEKYKSRLAKETAILEEQKKALQQKREQLNLEKKDSSSQQSSQESTINNNQKIQYEALLQKEKNLEKEIHLLRQQMKESLTHKDLDQKTISVLKELQKKASEQTNQSLQKEHLAHNEHEEQYKKQIELLQNEIKQIRATTASLLKKHTSPPTTYSSHQEPTHIHIHSSQEKHPIEFSNTSTNSMSQEATQLQSTIENRLRHKSPFHQELERIVRIHDTLEIIHALLHQKKFVQAKNLYEESKEQTKKISLHVQEQQAIIKHLQSIAQVLSSLSNTSIHSTKQRSSTNNTGSVNFVSKDNNNNHNTSADDSSNSSISFPLSQKQTMNDYVEALEALQQKNKEKALALFIELYKKNPKNKAIRSRLEESLELSPLKNTIKQNIIRG
ncbi:MAG: hypothetical protein ACOCQQ_00545 [Candidatus Nanoarchaeia archaeon]